MTEIPNPIAEVPPSEQGQNLDMRELMEEANVLQECLKM